MSAGGVGERSNAARLFLTPSAGSQTHFVSAVTYGAEAYLLFELECSTVEQKKRMQGALKAALAGVDVGAAVDADTGAEFEMERARVRVRFHGDLRVPITVTTMEDALELLQVWCVFVCNFGE